MSLRTDSVGFIEARSTHRWKMATRSSVFVVTLTLFIYVTHAACVKRSLEFCNMLTHQISDGTDVTQAEAQARQFLDQILIARRKKLGLLHEDKLEFCEDMIQSALCAALLPECDSELELTGQRHRKPCKVVELAVKYGCDWDMSIGDLTFAEPPDCFMFPFRTYDNSNDSDDEDENNDDEEEEEDEDSTYTGDLHQIGDILTENKEFEYAHFAFATLLRADVNDRKALEKLTALMHSADQRSRFAELMMHLTNSTNQDETRQCLAGISSFPGRSDKDAINEERKAQILAAVGQQHGLKRFVETGTWYGTTLQFLEPHFDSLLSIEISGQLVAAARKRFEKSTKIQVMNADSATALPQILEQLGPNDATLFWLDAHFSGSRFETGRSHIDTSLLPELDAILGHPCKEHVIVIDDARMFQGFDKCFGHYGTECYPPVEALQELICRKHPGMVFDIKEDLIRIYKKPVDGTDTATSDVSGATIKPPKKKGKKSKNAKIEL